MGGADKFGGCYIGGRDSLLFKVNDIVRTARNAGPSIAEGFNDGVTFVSQLSLYGFGSWTCHRWFHPPQHLFDAVLLTEHFLYTIEEEGTFRLANIE